MDVFEAISKRKSVRKYKSEPVKKELIKKIIDAGRQAPSGNNEQPVDFIVVKDSMMRKHLAEICEYGKFIAESPVCIVVFSRETKYYLEDGCAAIENILLASTAVGVSTCWVAGDKKHYSRFIGNLLKVPQNYKLIALISLGYENGNVNRKIKRNLNEVLHWEKY